MSPDLEFSRLIATAKDLGDKAAVLDASNEPVLLRIEKEAALTDNGKICFEAALLLLIRMTRSLTIEVQGSAQFLWEMQLLASRLTQHEVLTIDSGECYEKFKAILNIGTEVGESLPWTTVNSDGWLVRVSSSRHIPFTSELSNPVGALAAAALGATEVFKRISCVKNTRGPLQDFLSYSFFYYSPSESPGPQLPRQIDINGLIQVGAGAIGNGIDFLLKKLRIRGSWSIVDYQEFRKENLGTCILIGPDDVGKSKAVTMAAKVAGSTGFPNKIQEFISEILGKQVSYPRIVINGLDDIDARRAVQNMWPDLALDGAIGPLSCEVTLHPWGPDLSCLMCDFELPAEDSTHRNSRLIGVASERLWDLTAVVTEQDVQAAPESKKQWLSERIGKQYCSILTPDELARISDLSNDFSPSTPFVACLSSCMILTELIRWLIGEPPVLETGFQFDVLIGPQNGIKKSHSRKNTCICVNRKAVIESTRAKRRNDR